MYSQQILYSLGVNVNIACRYHSLLKSTFTMSPYQLLEFKYWGWGIRHVDEPSKALLLYLCELKINTSNKLTMVSSLFRTYDSSFLAVFLLICCTSHVCMDLLSIFILLLISLNTLFTLTPSFY